MTKLNKISADAVSAAFVRLRPLREQPQFIGDTVPLPQGGLIKVRTSVYERNGVLWACGVFVHQLDFNLWLKE